jgi:synaptobrevin family protein YKT6
MKIFIVAVFQTHPDGKHMCVNQALDVSNFSYFTQSSIAEYLKYGCKLITQRIAAGTRQTIDLTDDKNGYDLVAHAFKQTNGTSVCVITDREYPTRTALTFVANVHKLTEVDQSATLFLTKMLQTYQNPAQVDKLWHVQNNLDQLQASMRLNVQQLLERGETLDDLIQKTDDLSNRAKLFQRRAAHLNRCWGRCAAP